MRLVLLLATVSLLVTGSFCQNFDFSNFFKATGEQVVDLLIQFIEENKGQDGFSYTFQDDQAGAQKLSLVNDVPYLQAVSTWLTPDRKTQHTDIIEAGINGTKAKSMEGPFTRSGLSAAAAKALAGQG